jgi:hypothetical protein
VLAPSAPHGDTQAENDRIRASLQSFLGHRSVLLRLLGYCNSYGVVPRADPRLKSFLLAYVSGGMLYPEGMLRVAMIRSCPRARGKLTAAEPIRGMPP